MVKLKIFCILLMFVYTTAISAQVKIRLFANQSPESAIFTVTTGKYEINLFNGETITVFKDEPVMISKYNGRIACKKRGSNGYICDSLNFSGKTGKDSFSLRVIGSLPVRKYYSGDLQCFPDLGTLVLINISAVEEYIAGVVLAEGGTGKNLEYFKTQAIIARTYMYKYFDKHLTDRYNVCDNTHCQVFNGLSSDSLLNEAAYETKGLVILDNDSSLIISTFHSNCGGETSSSDDVWLSGHYYLKSVSDPYCLKSRNAFWQKRIQIQDWLDYLRKEGFTGTIEDPSVFVFIQNSRMRDYKSGSFSIPLRTIRLDLNLRSTFFSVFSDGDYIILKGRGYGHGVGLCQEGAMEMAVRGFSYKQIIDFYYFNVLISDIKNAVALPFNH
jgi:stage II sporulation protein D